MRLMMPGWMGKVLRVDLSTKVIRWFVARLLNAMGDPWQRLFCVSITKEYSPPLILPRNLVSYSTSPKPDTSESIPYPIRAQR